MAKPKAEAIPARDGCLRGLIDEGATLAEQAKLVEAELAPLKEDLAGLYAAGILGKKNAGEWATLSFSDTPVFDPISVSGLFDVLKKYGKEGLLFSVLTVSMTKLKEILPPDEIKSLQGAQVATKVSCRFGKLGC